MDWITLKSVAGGAQSGVALEHLWHVPSPFLCQRVLRARPQFVFLREIVASCQAFGLDENYRSEVFPRFVPLPHGEVRPSEIALIKRSVVK